MQTLLTVDKIKECHGGEWVPVPYWVENVLLECGRMGQEGIVEEVRKRIGRGRISIGLLRVLYDFHCKKGFYR